MSNVFPYNEPATEKQLQKMDELGIKYLSSVTKRSASKLISNAYDTNWYPPITEPTEVDTLLLRIEALEHAVEALRAH